MPRGGRAWLQNFLLVRARPHRYFIKHPAQLRLVLRHGKRVRGDYWLLHVLRTRRRGARLAVVVSKKQVARAVRRNRIRRVVREFFRQQRAAALPPVDILSRYLGSAADDDAHLRADFDRLLARAVAQPSNNNRRQPIGE